MLATDSSDFLKIGFCQLVWLCLTVKEWKILAPDFNKAESLYFVMYSVGVMFSLFIREQHAILNLERVVMLRGFDMADELKWLIWLADQRVCGKQVKIFGKSVPNVSGLVTFQCAAIVVYRSIIVSTHSWFKDVMMERPSLRVLILKTWKTLT